MPKSDLLLMQKLNESLPSTVEKISGVVPHTKKPGTANPSAMSMYTTQEPNQ